MEWFGCSEVTARGSEYPLLVEPADADLPVVTLGYFAVTLY